MVITLLCSGEAGRTSIRENATVLEPTYKLEKFPEPWWNCHYLIKLLSQSRQLLL